MGNLFKKYREIIVYIGVGLLTTVVAYGVRFAILYPVSAAMSLDLSDNSDHRVAILRTVAISAGWVAGVIFAFFTNKSWVFRDGENRRGRVARQFGAFVLSRLGTYFVEWGIGVLVPMLLIGLGFSTFHLILDIDADMVATCISVVVVTVLNYILSKLLVFRKKKGKEKENENG